MSAGHQGVGHIYQGIRVSGYKDIRIQDTMIIGSGYYDNRVRLLIQRCRCRTVLLWLYKLTLSLNQLGA